ncbi:MAG: sulfite exporter TauE/SafE family protein [Bdellovibrionaceae bacterium]|nr:sulfite exporter TauE/SafE family protein [Pseudobdellovibrionaceae bacterium]
MEVWHLDFFIITVLFFVVAVVYSSVGHAGASGYSAVMALFGISPLLMRPTSLMLNLVVGSIGLYRFHKAGLVNLRKVGPFLVASMPAAYWSAQLNVEKTFFYSVLGFVLLVSGLKLVFGKPSTNGDFRVNNVSLPVAMSAGGIIGVLSGVTGTGGAIFFTPLLLKMKWADPKHAAGLSVVFVLANSVFGLAGIFKSSVFFDIWLTAVWIIAATIGAVIGTYFGVFRFSNSGILKVLGAVMIVAAIKLLSILI